MDHQRLQKAIKNIVFYSVFVTYAFDAKILKKSMKINEFSMFFNISGGPLGVNVAQLDPK